MPTCLHRVPTLTCSVSSAIVGLTSRIKFEITLVIYKLTTIGCHTESNTLLKLAAHSVAAHTHVPTPTSNHITMCNYALL